MINWGNLGVPNFEVKMSMGVARWKCMNQQHNVMRFAMLLVSWLIIYNYIVYDYIDTEMNG